MSATRFVSEFLPADTDPLARFPRLRQSLLSKMDDCSLSARFELEYQQGWSSQPAARGQIVHRAIGACLEKMVQQDETSVPVDVAMAELEHVFRQSEVPMDGPDDQVVPLPIRVQADARVTMRTWASYMGEYDVDQIAGVERRFDATIAYPGDDGLPVERVLTGKMDLLLIDGAHATVVDWKDTFGVPPEKAEGVDDVSEEGYFQQRMYAWLLLRTYAGLQAVTLREVYVRFLSGRATDAKGRPINPVRTATVDRTMLPEIEAELAALVERFDRSVASGIWRASPGGHCSWCSRPERCTIFPTARGVGRITSAAEAEVVAGRMLVARAAADAAAASLRSWGNRHGDTPVKDAKKRRVYGPVVRTRVKSPGAAEVRRAVADGRPVDDLFTEEEYVTFTLHAPEERHPHIAAVAQEENLLLAMEKAAQERAAGGGRS